MFVLLTIYHYTDGIKDYEMGGKYSTHGVMRSGPKILGVKPKVNEQLEKPRPMWEDNIVVGLKEFRCEFVVWIKLAQDSNQ
jgi:hypothetical protein